MFIICCVPAQIICLGKFCKELRKHLSYRNGPFSDFHKLAVTVLNEKHERMSSKVIQYRDLKKYDYLIFNNNLGKETENLNFSELDFATLRKIFIEILDKFSPLKKKYTRANHSKFVTKKLSKPIMLKSKLRNQLLKTKSQEFKMKYNKQK